MSPKLSTNNLDVHPEKKYGKRSKLAVRSKERFLNVNCSKRKNFFSKAKPHLSKILTSFDSSALKFQLKFLKFSTRRIFLGYFMKRLKSKSLKDDLFF